ncbi:transporter substrate-binding domain-containing protein [Marinomonas transparens]|uniref:Transporter substrate-binding domain-containing protein n=1 Tax=Marinomonas transparens TaxID=2795388 RepID=A0A934N4R3_9GAMM|nr:transporter substrate-binding domain-containing protein [Marinomonas transparens]MBJ7536276.1 transporter substrate-binding domain-containing protein [Marinomonas transparens]
MLLKPSLILAASALMFSVVAQADRLEDIQKQGYITVGTTGDYKPFSFYDGKQFSGYDIDVAKYFAAEMGVEVKFFQTTWKGLLEGLDDDKYDIAMGGITRRISRQMAAEQTQGYMTFGKCFLVAQGREASFDTLAEVNRPEVRVGVNIGGTNEKFADKFLNKATIVRFENNLDVPKAVVAGKVDVMVTETPEALYYQVINKKLDAVREDNPFTKSQFGYLIPDGEQRLLNTVNFMMDEMKLKGVDEALMKQNSLK